MDKKFKENGISNVSSRKQVNKGGDRERDRREEQLNDICIIMSNVHGRRFMYRLVNELCHYDKDDFNNSGSITFRSLGERNIGRITKSDCCEASLELWQLAEKENWEFITKGE